MASGGGERERGWVAIVKKSKLSFFFQEMAEISWLA